MNNIVLSGNVVATPVLNNGEKKPYTRFRLAVKRKFSKDKTDFFNMLAYDKQAELICQYVEKGATIIAQGSLICTEYTDKEGNLKTQTTIVVENCDFVRKASADNSALIEEDGPIGLPF